MASYALQKKMFKFEKYKREKAMPNPIMPEQLTWLFYRFIFRIYIGTCSVAQLCPIHCNPMDCSTPDFPVLHHLLEFAQTHVHWVDDAIQPSHPLLTPSPPTFSLPQNQGLFQGIGFSNQVAKILQLQHQSFQSKFRASLVAQTIKNL